MAKIEFLGKLGGLSLQMQTDHAFINLDNLVKIGSQIFKRITIFAPTIKKQGFPSL